MSSSAKKSNLFRVAIVGAAALKGKEVRDVLSERNFPSVDIKLLDDEDSFGQLEQVNDEPTFIQGVLPEHLDGVDFTFLTADESYVAKKWATVRDAGSEIIDLSYALENNTDIVLRAPWVERELGHTHPVALQSAPVMVAHPASVTLALLLARLQKAAPIQVASAVIGQPASEYGRRGMDELHDQTVNLLSFQTMPTTTFGTQASFNLYAQTMQGAQPSLAEVESRVVRHFKAIVQGEVSLPALLLVQTPVFHGYTIAMFVQTAADVTAEILEKALAGPHITVSTEPDEFPSNVNIAGSSEILANIRADSERPNGFWLFAACDNLRVSAIQAIECAEEMVQTRPRGQLQ
jgi:aspartate-semialdehyde dehydrogenase